jgi:hypothetical protein
MLGKIMFMINSCPSINGCFSQSLRQIWILILEIRQCIPVVKILIFLDLFNKFTVMHFSLTGKTEPGSQNSEESGTGGGTLAQQHIFANPGEL